MALRNIPEDKVISRISLENVWWEKGEIDPFYARLGPRACFRSFRALVEEARSGKVRRAPILMGPRRVGKTVLLYHLIRTLIADGLDPRRICYLSVEHPVFNGLGLDDLVRLALRASGAEGGDPAGRVFIFDEVQYLRSWELHLKTLVDRHPRTAWIASGSAAAALRLKSHESGAGRFTEFLLPPLTFHEYVSLLGHDDLVGEPDRSGWFGARDLGRLNELFVDYLNFGGYPEVALSPTIRADPSRYIRQDIIDKVLLRDLPSLYGIADIQELNSLFTALAFNTANEVSLETLSGRAGIAKNTIKRYLEYLEAAFLVRRIHRVGHDARRFQRATVFKTYLTNPSMRAALFSPIGAEDPDAGDLVETAVFAQWFHAPGDADLHYARWKDGEVDLVGLARDKRPGWACEVKWSDRFAHQPDDLRSLLSFCKTHGLPEALVTTRTERKTTMVNGVALDCVPASLYCYTVGRKAVEG